MFNPVIASENIKEEYIDYIRTIFPLSTEELKDRLLELLKESVSKGPYVSIQPIYKADKSMLDLINEGELCPLFKDLEFNKPIDKYHKIYLPLKRPLYKHQVEAIKKSKNGNIVVTAGTGSGKTECFLIPVLNELLKEKEARGRIADQVKVLIIYPMNALANDQMKRLRNILMYYPEITFGSYTGDTEWEKHAAEAKYLQLHEFEEAQELRLTEKGCGLVNEIKSRDEMLAKPPHILITNYAMLERMLLVPNNDVLFKNADLKYVVLDEAHVYSGTKGMETCLLLRRLLARVNPIKTKFILTSATLGAEGESEEDIVDFANNLTGSLFTKDSVIFGKRDNNTFDDEFLNIDEKFFIEAASALNDASSIEKICQKYSITYDKNIDLKENIFNICSHCKYYENLCNNYLKTINDENFKDEDLVKEIKDIKKDIGTPTLEGAIAFLYACGYAEKNNKGVLDARYHFFLRALEGCYITFSEDNNIFLNRIAKDEAGYKAFELAICRKCGDLALFGYISDDGILEQRSGYFDKEQCKYFHIRDFTKKSLIEDEDDDVIKEEDEIIEQNPTLLNKGSHKIEKYYLCPKCGKITKASDGKPTCDCKVEILEVYSAQDNYEGCLSCNGGKYSKFYIGNDAATGVIATSLYEQLPIKPLIISKNGIDFKYDGGKQFLTFSDSRSDAAYFASYLDKIYEVFLRRRAIYNVIHENLNELEIKPWNLEELAKKVENLFIKHNTFKLNIVEEGTNIASDSRKNAWYGVLTEVTTINKRNSLASLGCLVIEYGDLDNICKGIMIQPKFAKHINKETLRPLLNELILTIVYWGAIRPNANSIVLDENDREFIFYSKKQKYVTLKKEYDSGEKDADTNNISSWLPRTLKKNPNKFIKNSRYHIACQILGINEGDDEFLVKDLLQFVFNHLTLNAKPGYRLILENNCLYYFSASAFIVKSPYASDVHWYYCDKCGKVSNFSIDGKCTISGCNGDCYEIVDIDLYFKDNHYRKMYEEHDFRKLFIKEHTAQLSGQDSSSYQTEFEKNRINSLSCSTTFEMGVDVGSLETVFLRDVPPNPSNYAQRSGRAGRSKESNAYTITYAKLSSHDFNYFAKPNTMISGKIMPPKFKINNEKITLRHIFAVTLAYLFKENIIPFKSTVDFLSKKTLDDIREVLSKKEQNVELTEILRKSFKDINCGSFKADKYDWVDKFVGNNGALTLLINDFVSTEKAYQDLINKYMALTKENILNSKKSIIFINKVKSVGMQKSAYENIKVIDALSKGNVLPKYGFPVDNVTLDIGNQDVELARDLSVAISEYAPGETVIANGRKYVSRYIKKMNISKDNQTFREIYFSKCSNPDCNTYNYSPVEPFAEAKRKCSGCGQEIETDTWEKAIIPENGFFHDKNLQGPVSILRKPERIYRSEDCYVGDNKAIKAKIFIFGDKKIELKYTENDEIMVVSNEPFYVCKNCGYTYGPNENIKDKHGNVIASIKQLRLLKQDKITISETHSTRFGNDCSCHDFYRYYLTHIYKTDVVQMRFDDSAYASPSCIYSVMTALLDSIANTLDIERTDLNGCIKRVGDFLDIILYDAVPGGAGHVKRILENEGKNLQLVIYNAFNKLNSCNCGSSCYNCLRNYYNQKYHDELNRFDAMDFLSEYKGNVVVVDSAPNNPLIEQGINHSEIINEEEFIEIIKDNIQYVDSDSEEKKCYDKLLLLLEKHTVYKPTYVDIDCKVDNKIYSIFALWEDLKIALVDSDQTFEIIDKDSQYQVFNINKMEHLSKLISKIGA